MTARSFDVARFLSLLLPVALVSCAPQPQPGPPPPPPAPSPPPPPPVRVEDWRDWPITAGAWQYARGTVVTVARYGDGPISQFAVRCDLATRRVTLMRSGMATEMTIITTTRSTRFTTGHVDDRGAAMSGAILNAGDTFLDAIAFSRGKFAVMSPGLVALALPAWAEPARVVEDCRK